MEEVEIPSYFLCPISLQIMRDPVTLTTGISYERESIERWIFSGKHEICPVTKQPLPDLELTPNHTLRRLIQAWCAANASYGIERFPTPRPPVDKAQIAALLDEAKLPHSQMSALRKLKAIVSESERNKRCVVEASGAVDFLASLIKKSKSNPREHEQEGIISINDAIDQSSQNTASDEALSILYSLQISEQSLLHLIESNNDIIESLTTILRRSNYRSRAYAILLLKSLVSVIAPSRLTSFSQEFFEEVVSVLRDQISHQAARAALQVLGVLSPWGRNKVKAVEAGAVQVVIELLLDETERRACEVMLVVLDRLCGCAEGRAEMVGHAAGLAVVSKKVVGVTQVASERAVRILYSVARFSPTPAVLHEMVQVGVVTKLCMFLQMESGEKAKEKAKEILRLHSKVWRNSPCLAPEFLASYPR
ncbi:E3 ubiquitin-protein ligase PUB22 [Elaeis guineensis]|uniref:U-box domain-containing protein n=1 Tax=Elaeis guineensis var. tenera TaxID=51953 RepID=A0A6I9RS38_ELAGV|nr:E3 ubiquitin-protein ligase PUB22 [Elaeis guineensis]